MVIKIWTADSEVLLLSVYIPPVPLHTPDEASAEPALTAIRNTIQTTLQEEETSTCIVLSGDFNCHHSTWSGNNIQPQFTESASELIDFLQVHCLHSCLPRGTATFWSLGRPGRSSTINQTVTNKPSQLVKCYLYHKNYGSDHRETYSEWSLKARRNPAPKAREWKGINTNPALGDAIEMLRGDCGCCQ